MAERYPGVGKIQRINKILGRPQKPFVSERNIQSLSKESYDKFEEDSRWYMDIHRLHAGKDALIGFVGSILLANLQHQDLLTAVPAVIGLAFSLNHTFKRAFAKNKLEKISEEFEAEDYHRQVIENQLDKMFRPYRISRDRKDRNTLN